MTILLSFTWAILSQFASNFINMTLLSWHEVSIYLASLSQRQISYEASRNDSQGSFSKQVRMNNKWLVWQIRRGQASVGETDVLLWWCAGYMPPEQRGDAADTDHFQICGKTADLSLNPYSCALAN